MIWFLPIATIIAYKSQLTPYPPYTVITNFWTHQNALFHVKRIFSTAWTLPIWQTPYFLWCCSSLTPANHTLLSAFTASRSKQPLPSLWPHCTLCWLLPQHLTYCTVLLWFPSLFPTTLGPEGTRFVTCFFSIPAQYLSWMDRLMNMLMRMRAHTHTHTHIHIHRILG